MVIPDENDRIAVRELASKINEAFKCEDTRREVLLGRLALKTGLYDFINQVPIGNLTEDDVLVRNEDVPETLHVPIENIFRLQQSLPWWP